MAPRGDPAAGGRPGTLFVVATPIGNLDDITVRAAETLRRVDVVAAEDTRRTATLLRHLGSRARMVSLHRFSERAREGGLLGLLHQGREIALVSDAGTPTLSDPGARLVAAAHRSGIPVVPVPGPSAVAAALSVSGIPADRFLFLGFLPSKGEARRRALEEVAPLPYTLVLYEAPHRIRATLQEMLAVLGDRQALLAREMTKVHETCLLGTISKILEAPDLERGEITLVVEGSPGGGAEKGRGASVVRELVTALVTGGRLSPKECGRLLARLNLGSSKEIYGMALEAAREEDEDGGP